MPSNYRCARYGYLTHQEKYKKTSLNFYKALSVFNLIGFNGSEICRDYFIAQHQLGAQCWVFVDQKSRWYLHGYFG